MAAKKKEVVPKKDIGVNGRLDERMAGMKAGGAPLLDLFQYADEYTDLDIVCQSTGFASLDALMHPKLLGAPRGRIIEIFSPDGNVGKSTITRQIIRAWQQAGLQTALAEPEKTDTQAFWDDLGIITSRNHPTISAMRIMRPKWDLSTEETTLYSAEQFLDAVLAAAQVMDLIVLDSIDALVKATDIVKEAEDNDTVGGISKLLSSFFRKATNNRATIICVNQMRYAIGKFSHGGPPMTTTGGKAPAFYASIRLMMTRVETLKDDKEGSDPYGFKVQFKSVKNKIAPQDRVIQIPFIHGEGFSQAYDLFNLAVKIKLIDKQKGGWYQFPAGDLEKKPQLKQDPNFTRIRGELNMYYELRDNPVLFKAIKAILDGEDVEPDVPEIPLEVLPEQQAVGA